jgi:hypothetical protein
MERSNGIECGNLSYKRIANPLAGGYPATTANPDVDGFRDHHLARTMLFGVGFQGKRGSKQGQQESKAHLSQRKPSNRKLTFPKIAVRRPVSKQAVP